MEWLLEHTAAGNIEQNEDTWHLLSGQRKTTIQLPEILVAEVVRLAKQEGKTMSEYIEEAVLWKVNRDSQD